MMEERNRHRFAREIKNCADRIAGADDAALPVYVHKLLSAILRMAEREGLAPGDMAVKNDTVTAVDTDISSLTSRAREYKAWYEAVSKPFEAMRREKEISGAVSDELSEKLDDAALREITENSDLIEKALTRLDKMLSDCVAAEERDHSETLRLIDPDSSADRLSGPADSDRGGR